MMETANHFLVELGMGGMLLGTIIEALGIPFPGGLMLILAGILISGGRLNFTLILIMAVIGFNIGAATAFFIGRIVGEPFFYRFERVFKISHKKLDRARSWVEQSSAAFVLAGRFVPMVGNVTPYLAGMSRLSPLRFILYNSIFAVVWSLFNIGLGYYFSRTWHVIFKFIEKRLPYMAVAAILIYLAAAVLVKKRNINKS